MTLFIVLLDDSLEIRLPSPPGPILADFRTKVRPGESFAGYSYQSLRRLGSGRHDLPDPPEEGGDSARAGTPQS